LPLRSAVQSVRAELALNPVSGVLEREPGPD